MQIRQCIIALTNDLRHDLAHDLSIQDLTHDLRHALTHDLSTLTFSLSFLL